MFLPTDHSKQVQPGTVKSTFGDNDWGILARFWHPVATSTELETKPLALMLLDLRIVLWRTAEGVHAAKDVCMHRGARLSGGSVKGAHLVCPLHGFEYDEKGVCRAIPALQAGAPIPRRLRLEKFLVQEHWGLIWICLSAEPAVPLPDWSILDRAPGTKVVMAPDTWEAAAARHVENFNDIAHFPFVHKGTFGTEAQPLAPYDVKLGDNVLSFQMDLEEKGRYAVEAATEAGETTLAVPTVRRVRYTYTLTYPFASHIAVLDLDRGTTFHIFDVASPITAMRSRVFQVLVDESGKNDAATIIRNQTAVNAEDAPIVAGQSPWELPLDLREEIHIPADRMSIEYRRGLARFGLGASVVLGEPPDAAHRS